MVSALGLTLAGAMGEVCDVAYMKAPVERSQQGMALWGNWLMAFENGGRCCVYDRSGDGLRLDGVFEVESSSPSNHCNQANFGVEQLSGAEVPVVYLTVGKPGSPLDMRCHVESISRENGEWRSRLVQTIDLDTAGWHSSGLNTIFGSPSWLIDRERDALWVFSARLRTLPRTTGSFDRNKYVATRLRFPRLAEGGHVTLTTADVLEQVVFDMDVYVTQSGCMHDGKIFYSFGFGEGHPDSPSRVRVYDTDKRMVSARVDLDSLIPEECEAVMIDGDRMLINTNSRKIYAAPVPVLSGKSR